MRIFMEGAGGAMRNVSSVQEYTQRENKNFSRKSCSYQLLLGVSDAWLSDLGMQSQLEPTKIGEGDQQKGVFLTSPVLKRK